MKFRPKAKFPEFDPNAKVGKRADGKYREVLEIPMTHGDMMVMHGTAIHTYYEVSAQRCAVTEAQLIQGSILSSHSGSVGFP